MTLLVLGLGNPGDRFAGTRHNIGFDVVDTLAQLRGVGLKKAVFRPFLWSGPGPVILAKPLAFMNRSGDVIPALLRRAHAGPADLVVVCDNLDLEPGRVRIKRRGTSRSHNGLSSVMDALGTGEFIRLYIGIGRPSDGNVVDYVLGRPPSDENPLYDQARARAADAIERLAGGSVDQVMNDLNRIG